MVPTRYGREKANELYEWISGLDKDLQKGQGYLCSKEMCPCVDVDVRKWSPFEQALLLGATPASHVTPRAYIEPDKQRNYFVRPDGFVETFGQCYELYSQRTDS